MFASFNTLRKRSTSLCRARYRPSANRNNGPGALPLIARYLSIAVIGHNSLSVRPMKIRTPYRNGSVLLPFRDTRIVVGAECESRAMSPTVRCTCRSKLPSLGTVNSPDLIKPKNPRQKEAHNITTSGSSAWGCHVLRIWRSTSGVIGRRAWYPDRSLLASWCLLGHIPASAMMMTHKGRASQQRSARISTLKGMPWLIGIWCLL